MSKAKDYETKTEELAAPHAAALGLSIYDVEYVKEGHDYYLRIYIDKPGGVDISDCEKLSGYMNPILDEEDFIDDAYIFEVSSPGLGRTLKKDRHLAASIGESVEGKLFKAESGSKEFSGVLKAFDKDTITIETPDGEGLSLRVYDRKNIANLRLSLDF